MPRLDDLCALLPSPSLSLTLFYLLFLMDEWRQAREGGVERESETDSEEKRDEDGKRGGCGGERRGSRLQAEL